MQHNNAELSNNSLNRSIIPMLMMLLMMMMFHVIALHCIPCRCNVLHHIALLLV